MSSRLSFAAVTLLLGVLLWGVLAHRPTSSPPPPAAPGDSSARRLTGERSGLEPGANRPPVGEQPSDTEPGLDPPEVPGDSARVAAPPRTIRLGAVDEMPVAARAPGRPGGEARRDGVGVGEEAEAVEAMPPVTVMENYRAALRSYAARFGGNPVGDNAEITAALRGGNRRGATFLTGADGLRVNAAGEAVDVWGTPWFFHQLSRTEMEIRSAGPDRRMWTGDDLVMK